MTDRELIFKNSLASNIPCDWRVLTLGEMFHFKNGLNKEKKYFGSGYPIVNYTDVYNNPQIRGKNLLGKVNVTKREIELYGVQSGDVFFTRTSETLPEIGYASVIEEVDGPTVFSGFILRARDKMKVLDIGFKKYCFRTYQSRKEIIVKSSMTTRALTSGKLLSEVNVLVPPLNEQRLIAEILSTWDIQIELLRNLLQNTQAEKKALTSKIYRGLIGNNEKTYKRLKKHIREINSRNRLNNYNKVLSVSNSKGFIPQNQQFDREVASKNKSNYKIVSKHQFAYNPSRVNVGSIDLLENYDSGLLSPMYIVFECLNTIDHKYLYHFLKSELFLKLVPKYTQGSVRDSLSFSGLSSMKIYLPSIEEQIKYARLLDSFDEKNKLIENEIEFYDRQKLGLMQQLLTGKIRVKTS